MLDPDAASDVRVAAAEQLESSGALAETDRHYLTPPPPPAEESEDNEPSD
jgi:Tat protein secretion system quality control protein TatD with DNase activity